MTDALRTIMNSDQLGLSDLGFSDQTVRFLIEETQRLEAEWKLSSAEKLLPPQLPGQQSNLQNRTRSEMVKETSLLAKEVANLIARLRSVGAECLTVSQNSPIDVLSENQTGQICRGLEVYLEKLRAAELRWKPASGRPKDWAVRAWVVEVKRQLEASAIVFDENDKRFGKHHDGTETGWSTLAKVLTKLACSLTAAELNPDRLIRELFKFPEDNKLV